VRKSRCRNSLEAIGNDPTLRVETGTIRCTAVVPINDDCNFEPYTLPIDEQVTVVIRQ
jgi:hypothetical protein